MTTNIIASMSIIPQDIVTTHILHHLPSKSVGRFRCVSKEWLSLLSDSQFIQRHQKTLNKNHIIFGSSEFCSNGPRFSVSSKTELRLELRDLHMYYGSANGLVLGTYYYNLYNVYTLTVLNPTTEDYVELLPHEQAHIGGMLGIGYDSATDDYKVVNICWATVHVYSLRKKTWTKRVTDSPYNHCSTNITGVFVNGFLYWIVRRRSKEVIAVFNLADDKLSALPSPSLHNKLDFNTRLVALGDKLAMFHTKEGHIWLMNEYGVHKSWKRIVVHGFNEIFIDRRTNVIYKNGKAVLLTGGLLWIYDVEEQTLCKSVDISHRVSYRDLMYYYVKCAYAESLISPKFSRIQAVNFNGRLMHV